MLAETNVVLNVEQLAKKLGRSAKSVDVKIYKLRRDGQFPPTDFSKSFDPRGRRFTENDDKRIIAMYKKGATYKEIGISLDRSEQSIGGRIMRLKKIGKLKQPKKQWSQDQINILLANIRFDENGFCCNHVELARLCNRTFEQVNRKLNDLRKKGVITVMPDRSKTSVKSKEAMNRFNDARFAHIPKKKEESTMKELIQPSFTVESREVSLILTTTIINGQRSEQYFSKDGQLIAQKKPTPVAAEVSK
nr:helix-turn-helix domain containing protein [Enterococcus avium]